MAVFKLKTSDSAVYNAFMAGQNVLTIDHLIQYDSIISIGAPVLFSFGGDGTPWTNGLYAIGKVHSKPIDLGYEEAARGQLYYKLEIEIVLRLPGVFEKRDFIRYPESFDSGVAPSTKGERNQALGIIEDNPPIMIASICRAILDKHSEYESQLREIFGNRIIDYALHQSIAFVLPPGPTSQPSPQHSSQTQKKISFSQIIYYGVPGCGKSYKVNQVIDAELAKHGITNKDEHKVRCVFHPEYCNADFVGQIYPYVLPDNNGVEYRFKPGPFAEVVRRAYLNPDKPYFLIIEEINRGNAAAIFGEMFQLLDRIDVGDEPDKSTENTYTNGWSSYGVDNIDVNSYIRQNKTGKDDVITYAEFIKYDNLVNFKVNTAIRLPPNLSVYATMNTSDQNVFTMDNAFQRRFKSKMIKNDLEDSTQYNLQIDDTGVCWGDFREWINTKILAPETGLRKAEDKCLGGWFIKGEKKTDEKGTVLDEYKPIPKDEFAEKVLKYLWNDVFKRNTAEIIFAKDKVTSLTSLIDAFESNDKFAAFENVFVLTENDKAQLQPSKD